MKDRGGTVPDASAIEACLGDLLGPTAQVACDVVQDCTTALYPEEHAAIARAIDKRRHEFSTGRHLARRAMQAIGREPAALPVGPDRQPVWPASLVGSISHSAGICAAAVASTDTTLALGIDLERIGDVAPDVMGAVAHPEELEANAGRWPEDLWRALLFSAREAVFKAYNPATGSYLGHRDVQLTCDRNSFSAWITAPGRPALFTSRLVQGRWGCADGMMITVVQIARS